jgi:hypothetical protein
MLESIIGKTPQGRFPFDVEEIPKASQAAGESGSSLENPTINVDAQPT